MSAVGAGTVISVPYLAADGSDLVAEVSLPVDPGRRRFPAVVLFHGGSWRSNRKAQAFGEQCRFFAGRGLVAVSGTYRGIDSGASSLDDCLADARATVRWVRAMPNVDPTRIVVGGHSAGGQLALCLALLRDDAESLPAAAIALSPAINVPFAQHLSPSRLVGPGSPPILILQGARDSMAAPGFARRFTEQMTAAGNDCRLELLDGAHTFYAFRSQTYASFRHALTSMDRFLVERDYIAPARDLAECIDGLGTPPEPRRRTTKAM